MVVVVVKRGPVVIKRFIILTMLCATFLGGYYLGRLPGSPDIIGRAGQGYDQAAQVGQKLSAAVGGPEAEQWSVRFDGKTYGLGGAE